jgi:putative transposase
MYLSLVTDLYSKKIIGHNVYESLHATGAVSAMKHTLKNRRFKDEELIHHSDRGLQYFCDEYQGLLADSRILCSMTKNTTPTKMHPLNESMEYLNRNLFVKSR